VCDGRCCLQEIRKGDGGDHAAAAGGTRRHRGRFEAPSEGEERRSLLRVEHDLVAIVVQDAERGSSHPRKSSDMRALVVNDGKVVVEQRPDPQPGEGEVLVRVHGAGLNRGDLMQRMGRYPAPPGSPPDIPGLEFAGEVIAHGTGGDALPLGSAVFGIVGGGAQAELVSVPVGQCTVVPDNVDVVAAGGIAEVFITAHDAMTTIAGATQGETMFVPAIGSGVGTAALQLGKAFGLTVVGSARTQDKLDRSRALGLDHALLAPRELDIDAFVQELADVAGPIDISLDLVGGPYLVAELRAAAPRGRIVQIGALTGYTPELESGQLMMKRLRLEGTVLRPRSREEKAAATAAFADDALGWFASGELVPVIGSVVPLDQGEDAYELLATDEVFGKVVLDCR
jgi:NADPH2:quinone reductase